MVESWSVNIVILLLVVLLLLGLVFTSGQIIAFWLLSIIRKIKGLGSNLKK